MYIPELNQMNDRAEVLEFMRRFSFAILITSTDDKPIATHLPFLVEERGEKMVLISHLALENPQWKTFENQQCLVIFSEPHAYISPSLYDKELNVPTWNYLAVHTYGKAKIIEDDNQIRNILNQTVEHYEQAYVAQWNRLPEDYKNRLSRGIVAFEIDVSEWQAKKKISQNKTTHEQERIADSLSKSPHTHEQLIGEYMQKNQTK
ncbi:MAG: FMN-binding negative transcriptional regulator [Bacteroidetes bacterium]|nr:FMN-binding negative transcriptional regulator [Bacteroidota bacterium]